MAPVRADARSRLAAAVRRERRRLGWSQMEAADQIGIHVRHVQMLEARTVNVTLNTLEMIAKAFDVDITDLFATTKS